MWPDAFDLHVSVGDKIVRALVVYVFLIAVLRVIGKRELGQSNTLDLVVLLLVANAVQNAIIGADNTITGAVISALTLFAANELFSRAAYAFPAVSRLLEGTPTVLVEDGTPVPRALRRAGISLSELRSIARRQGFGDLHEVQTAILETNGIVTMLSDDEAKRYRDAAAGGLRVGNRRRAAQ